MTPEMAAKLRRSLIKHESYEKFPYTDTTGHITIGIGFNLSARGIDDTWINTQFTNDTEYFFDQLGAFSWFKDLNVDRQVVIIDMCFNLGFKNFMHFANLLHALSMHDYKQAAFHMLDSEWATQVKGRAASLAQGMLSGVYDI